MKLINIFILLLIIQGTIVLYEGVFATTGAAGYELVPYGANDSAMWNLLADPSGWAGSSLLTTFAGLVSLAGAIGIGTYLYTKSDTVLFFSIFTLLLGFASIPIIALYKVFINNIAFFGCTTLTACPQLYFVWIFTGGVLVLITITSILSWWSNRSMG